MLTDPRFDFGYNSWLAGGSGGLPPGQIAVFKIKQKHFTPVMEFMHSPAPGVDKWPSNIPYGLKVLIRNYLHSGFVH